VGFRDSGGVQRWRTVEGGITAARAVRDEILARRAKGERVKPNPRLRFGEAADRWWDARVVKLRPATQAAYGLSLKHLRARFDRTQLDELSVALVAGFVSDMERRGYAGWTIKGALTVVGSVFDYAARHLDWHGGNPVRQLERGERPKVEERDKRVLSADELDRLLAAVDPEHRVIFRFAAATGARLGEVLGVRWHAVAFDLGVVSFTHQLDRRGDYVPLKTKRSRRTIEIPPSLVARRSSPSCASTGSAAGSRATTTTSSHREPAAGTTTATSPAGSSPERSRAPAWAPSRAAARS
jgi:integrase